MGVLTPEQIKALNDADTLKLIIIMLISLIPVLLLVLRNNHENQKGRTALELRQVEQQIARDKYDSLQQEAQQKQTQSQQEVNIRLTVAVEKLVDEIRVNRAATIGLSDEMLAQGTNITAIRNDVAGLPVKTANAVVTSQQAVADQLLAAAKTTNENLADAITKIGQLPTTEVLQRMLREEVAAVLKKLDDSQHVVENVILESKTTILNAYKAVMDQVATPKTIGPAPAVETSTQVDTAVTP